ncbi:AMP-binding protein [Noviherbaspirillum suwonense]|uniref:Long-chain-fatty-acid--CoA ligase n=1 Tax=Noviherbaspirillum suwonense TaxID=1224511 RepID=A0ABY1QQJ7_9BURK|nr:AMP-binding protein [Noviherbaspirillum suwonense]SMP75047.1 long-chain acyl-CoA synthetase [Noviherbaspirillum suwonense]
MERTWLTSYPPDVPATISVDASDSLPALLARICASHAHRPAFSNQGATISYGELDRLSLAFAAYLQKVAALQKGERVAIMLPNLLQYPVALFGVLRAGGVVVNTNPLYTATELERQLLDSGASVLVVLDNFAHVAEQVLSRTRVRHVIVTAVGDMLHFPKAQIVNMVVKHIKHMVPEWHIDGADRFMDALEEGEQQAFEVVPLQADDTAFLQYTGGTTGVPKGAILSHGNMVANLEQTAAWVKSVLLEGEETAVIPLPLYHVFALTATLAFLRLAAHNVLITNPRDTEALVKELRHTRFSVMIGVNTLFNVLLDAPHIEQANHGSVKVVVAGGMAVQRAVAQRWHKVFGVPLIEGYGLTETSPIVTANPLTIAAYTGTIGLPLPSTDVAIMDDAGNVLGIGAPGELCVRGPQVMKGYWQRPEETAKVMTSDGWLRTGDIGVMDGAGYFRIVDRKKDVIVVSGFKVFPNEVEDAAMLHPGIHEAAAIPAPDEHSDEVVKLVVVRRDPTLTADALLVHLHKHLTGYKLPRYIVFRDGELPKSNIGKVLRRIVKEEEEKKSQVAA